MMNEQMIPHFKLEGGEDKSLVYETSYVANPATGKGFLAFSEDEQVHKQIEQKFYMIEDTTQRMTSGVWFMPDTKYLRVDSAGNLYTVSISKEDLKTLLINYLKGGFGDTGSLEHGALSDGQFIGIEHWIIEGPDTVSPIYKISLEQLGYNPADIPVGTVMRTAYVADEEFWNEKVITGAVTGYSISGLFSMKPSNSAFSATVHQTVPTEVQEQAKEVKDGVIESDGSAYTVQEGYVVDKSNLEGEKKEESTEPTIEDSPAAEIVEETASVAPFKTQSEDTMAGELNALKEAFSAQIDELKASVESYKNEADELRKALANKPLVNDKSFSKYEPKPTENKKKMTLGGQTFFY